MRIDESKICTVNRRFDGRAVRHVKQRNSVMRPGEHCRMAADVMKCSGRLMQLVIIGTLRIQVYCCQQYQCCSRYDCNGIRLESVHGRQSSITCRSEKPLFRSVDQQLALALDR